MCLELGLAVPLLCSIISKLRHEQVSITRLLDRGNAMWKSNADAEQLSEINGGSTFFSVTVLARPAVTPSRLQRVIAKVLRS